MKIIITLFILIASITSVYAESIGNEYGYANGWFNGQEATVKNVKLKIGEPAIIKVMINSNISGHVFVKLTNPLVTEPYYVIEGPSKIGESINNYDITNGWSQTYTWTIAPNGAWKNGNAPINVFVQFFNMKTKDNKMIEFTIANPHILDEQYPGSSSTPAHTSGITPGAPAPKEAPFVHAIAALVVMMVVWWWRRR
ncbi:MAG: sarcinarray family MAST domain-containing protein [Candidatus Methanoperedens sp.]|nr:sarcinarray family MAST domain-containing protein [Candidatus Methanoperedens sp.]MCZ7358760.1 sarcinarray family MAST domain-containing protein [Candidatus Methanoperedens sp.]HLB69634.1 sarcinarray family MAST domain-containing protein [Candidatus Methanoperedens sp.]